MEYKKAFTIIELLIVMVVIGIIASVALVSYSGISSSATNATIQADLKNASTVLKLYNAEYASYPTEIDPTTNCPTKPNASTSYCIKLTIPNVISGYYGTTNTYNLKIGQTSSNTYYKITDTSSPSQLSINLAEPTDCPTGFIPVPGSITYEQPGFCVMKYEAKNVGGVATSQAAGTPWVSVTQDTAATLSSAACSGCHLIKEPEWMTIAQNILNTKDNWSSGAVGTGYVYTGHVNSNPTSLLDASTNDTDVLYGVTGGTGNGSQFNSSRVLKLSNGQVVWDMSGNAREWSAGQTTGGQPGRNNITGFQDTNYNALTIFGKLAFNVTPSGTGIPGSNNWNNANGMGTIYSSTGDTVLRGFMRGGSRAETSYAGILALSIDYSPSSAFPTVGFRVAR